MNLIALHLAVREQIHGGAPRPARASGEPLSRSERAALGAWRRSGRRGRRTRFLLRSSSGLLLIWMVAAQQNAE